MDPTTQLRTLQEQILDHAVNYGLDPFRVMFELIDHDEMNEVASYGGFPTRYPHWRFGMEYEELQKGYVYGLQKIYELVINNDPCYAYLMKANSMVDQKMVMAHVYGHSDFFKNNLWFSQTNRKMIDEIGNHATRLRRYYERYTVNEVEDFLDAALSIEHLIDYHAIYSPYKKRVRYDFSREDADARPDELVHKLKSKEYMDKFINPREFLDQQKKRIEEDMQKKKKFPEDPEKDVLLFLIENAPLETWQRDVLSIVREESYYFAPQALTKIMNEGWAAYWHAKIMTEKCLAPSEVVDYADHHSSTLGVRPGVINPYKLGMELFLDIEERWNKGKFGREYAECDDYRKKENWDLKLGKGREKIFEVRRIYNDITFIDDFLTEEFAEKHKMFVYRYNAQTNQYEIADRNPTSIKKAFLLQLANMGQPVIRVVDGNYRNRSELLLQHVHEGQDLQIDESRDTLRNIFRVWKRPVHLYTIIDSEPKMFAFDGEKHHEETITESSAPS